MCRWRSILLTVAKTPSHLLQLKMSSRQDSLTRLFVPPFHIKSKPQQCSLVLHTAMIGNKRDFLVSAIARTDCRSATDMSLPETMQSEVLLQAWQVWCYIDKTKWEVTV